MPTPKPPYPAEFRRQMVELGVTEAGCLAHARRKFHELWVNHKSAVAEEALRFFVQLYEVEREAQTLDANERRRIRQLKAKPVADLMHAWLAQTLLLVQA